MPRHTRPAKVVTTGNDLKTTSQTYVRGASGRSRPGPRDTYEVDGVTHLFTGKCHKDCENVR